jgi:Ca2+/Na+ antiporter
MQYAFDKKETEAKAEQDKKDAVTRIVIYSISAGLVLVLLLAVFIFRSYRQKQRANIIIGRQKEEVEKQKQLVEEKQKEILDSIHYARRIQQSLMPTEKYIERTLNRAKRA